MHRSAPPSTFAGRPNASTERADGVGTPVQSDAVVGLFGFGRESLFKYAPEIVANDTDAVVRAVQMQLLATRFAHDLRGAAPRTLRLPRLADRICRIDDEILQDQPQYRAGDFHHA